MSKKHIATHYSIKQIMPPGPLRIVYWMEEEEGSEDLTPQVQAPDLIALCEAIDIYYENGREVWREPPYETVSGILFDGEGIMNLCADDCNYGGILVPNGDPWTICANLQHDYLSRVLKAGEKRRGAAHKASTPG